MWPLMLMVVSGNFLILIPMIINSFYMLHTTEHYQHEAKDILSPDIAACKLKAAEGYKTIGNYTP